MDPRLVRDLLERVRSSNVSIDEALESLRELPFRDLGFATVDHHRALRQGVPEVIFGERKTAEQIAAIARRSCAAGTTCW
jgi:NCAIR mutase (PurE)-related protein